MAGEVGESGELGGGDCQLGFRDVDGVGCRGDGAGLPAVLRGDGLDGGGLGDVQRLGVDQAVLGRFSSVRGVVDGRVLGGAGDGDVLCAGVGSLGGRECRCGHYRSAGFALHEDVQEEIVLGVVHVGGCIGLDNAFGLGDAQCEGTIGGNHVGDVESLEARHQRGFSRSALGNSPFGLVAAHDEVGAGSAVSDDVAVGVGEGVASLGHAHRPVVVFLGVLDVVRNDLAAVAGEAGEGGGVELAAGQGVGHGEVGIGGSVVSCGEDDPVARHEVAHVVDADVVLDWDGDINGVGCRSDVAGLITVLHGEGLDGCGLFDGQRLGVDRAVHGRVGAVQRVVDGGALGGAGDGDGLRLGVGSLGGSECRYLNHWHGVYRSAEGDVLAQLAAGHGDVAAVGAGFEAGRHAYKDACGFNRTFFGFER